MARKRHYRKPKKPLSKRGLWALCISLGSLAICAFVMIVSARNAGESDSFLLVLSMIAMAENFYAFYLGFRSMKDEEDGLFFRIAGATLSTFMVIVWVVLYGVGLSRIGL